jgi:hypothetical protein
MTVSTTSNKVSYAGNGATVAFAFSFPIFEQTDLRIILKVDATGVETVQTLTTHYTVSASPWTSGGTVTMVTAPASGETLIVKSDIPSTQGTDYPTAGNFPAASHEDALDRLTLIYQQMEETIGRTLTLAEATALSDFVVPDPGTNVVLYYDGAAFSWPVLTTLTPDSVATTAFTQTLLDDATAAAFMTTLGITAFAQTLLDDTGAAQARSTLGINYESLTALTELAEADLLFIYDDDAAAYKNITVANARAWLGGPTGVTPVATTSGRTAAFTSIPAWATRIDVCLASVSMDGNTDSMVIELGDSGGYETSGYLWGISSESGGSQQNNTTGFQLHVNKHASAVWHGIATLILVDPATFTWACSSQLARSDTAGGVNQGSGSKSLTAALDRIQVQLAGSTDDFDAGKISITYT